MVTLGLCAVGCSFHFPSTIFLSVIRAECLALLSYLGLSGDIAQGHLRPMACLSSQLYDCYFWPLLSAYLSPSDPGMRAWVRSEVTWHSLVPRVILLRGNLSCSTCVLSLTSCHISDSKNQPLFTTWYPLPLWRLSPPLSPTLRTSALLFQNLYPKSTQLRFF